MKKIQLKPLSRIEGEASLEIVLDDRGRFRDLRLKSDLFRGFERFCVGRPVEEMPFLASRICGICAEAHYLASLKALDRIFDRTPAPEVQKIRQIFFLSGFIRDHLTVISLFATPDSVSPVLSQDAFRVLRDLGLWRDFLEIRKALKEILEIVAGRRLHGGGGLPGGWSKALSAEEVAELKTASLRVHRGVRRLGEAWQRLFWEASISDNAPGFKKKRALLALSPDFVEGQLSGTLRGKNFSAEDYREVIEETESRWPGLKVTTLKGKYTYLVGPWARFSLWPSPGIPGLQVLYEKTLECLKQSKGMTPWGMHVLRVYELVLAAEKLRETVANLEEFRPSVSGISGPVHREGIGLVEAPRGLLIHHYEIDDRGRLAKVQIITPTAQNYRALIEDLEDFFKKSKKISEETLKQSEKIIRAYDPCIPCMLHILVTSKGQILKTAKMRLFV